MHGMFRECNKLKEIKGIEKFETSQVTDMSNMFYGCKELEKLDLSKFNTSKVTNIYGMFHECNKLKEIKGIEKFELSQVTDMSNMFYFWKELENLDLSKFDVSEFAGMEGMKKNNLKDID